MICKRLVSPIIKCNEGAHSQEFSFGKNRKLFSELFFEISRVVSYIRRVGVSSFRKNSHILEGSISFGGDKMEIWPKRALLFHNVLRHRNIREKKHYQSLYWKIKNTKVVVYSAMRRHRRAGQKMFFATLRSFNFHRDYLIKITVNLNDCSKSFESCVKWQKDPGKMYLWY